MAAFQLATISIMFLAFLPSQAQGCLSVYECCNRSKIDNFVTRFKVRDPSSVFKSSSLMDSAGDCQASSDGPVSRRSISPWTYTKDFNASRYPQNLWHASCSCDHCLSFGSSVHQKPRIYNTLEPKGNSVPIQQDTIVFYRLQCPSRSDWFYLEPRKYSVTVSCACVVPMQAKKGHPNARS